MLPVGHLVQDMVTCVLLARQRALLFAHQAYPYDDQNFMACVKPMQRDRYFTHKCSSTHQDSCSQEKLRSKVEFVHTDSPVPSNWPEDLSQRGYWVVDRYAVVLCCAVDLCKTSRHLSFAAYRFSGL